MRVFLTLMLLALALFLCGADESAQAKEEQEAPHFYEKVEVVGRAELRRTVQTVSVLRKEELDALQVFSLKESFTLVPGVMYLNTGHPGQLGYLYTRGSAPNQTVIAVNGVPLFDAASTLGVDLGQLSVNSLERIEFVRGPLGNFLGSNAMGGVLNLVTSDKDGWGLFFSGESDGSYGAGFNLRKESRSGYYGGSVDARSHSYGMENDRFKGLTASANAGIKGERYRAGISLLTTLSSTGIPLNMGYPTLNRNFDRKLLLINAPLSYFLSPESSLELNLSWQRHLYRLEDPDDLWSPFYHTRSSQFRATGRYRLGRENFSLNALLDYAWSKAESGDSKELYGFAKSGSLLASALNLSWQTGSFVVSGGIRADKYWEQKLAFSPQLGINWEVLKRMHLHGSYSRSFRAPMLEELYNPLYGNGELQPEKGECLDGGVSLYLDNLELAATAFYSRYLNLIGYSPLTRKFANISKATVSGLEFSLTYRPLKGLKLIPALTLLDSHDWQYERELLRRPKSSFTMQLNYRVGKFNADLKFVYVGKRLDYNEIIWSVDRSPAYNHTTLALAYKLGAKTELFARLSNLFDQDFQEIMGYPAPGRRWSLGLRMHN